MHLHCLADNQAILDHLPRTGHGPPKYHTCSTEVASVSPTHLLPASQSPDLLAVAQRLEHARLMLKRELAMESSLVSLGSSLSTGTSGLRR